MFSKTQKIVTGTALALGVGVLGLAAAGAANAAAPESDHSGNTAKTATLVEVPGVKLPTDVKPGVIKEIGPVDVSKLPATGTGTTGRAPAGSLSNEGAGLVEVPGVKLPTDVKVGHATPVGPVDPANIPAGPHTTAPAPKA